MATLLYIKASPRSDTDSYSNAAAKAFLDRYRATHPADQVVTMDVSHDALPEFLDVAAAGKYKIMRGLPHSPAEAAAWKLVEAQIQIFKAADKVVISSPMWNFGIPYRLKQYIDNITQPGYTFKYTPEKGYEGLVPGKPSLLILARGGEYAVGTAGVAYDFQRPYLENALGFMGFRNIQEVLIEPTLAGGPEVAKAKLAAAKTALAALAETF